MSLKVKPRQTFFKGLLLIVHGIKASLRYDFKFSCVMPWTTLLVWIKVYEVICFINNCHIFFQYDLHETLAWLLHFAATKIRKIDQRSYVLLNIKVFTFDLKIGPQSALLGHSVLLLQTALENIWPDYCMLIIDHPTSLTIQAHVLQYCRLILWQSFCIIHFFQYRYLFKNAFKLNSFRLLTNDRCFCDTSNFRNMK